MKRKINLACFILLATFIIWSFLPVSFSLHFFKNSGFGATGGAKVLMPLSYISGRWSLVLILLATAGIAGHLMQFMGKAHKAVKLLLFAPVLATILYFAYSIIDIAFIESDISYQALKAGKDFWKLDFGWGYYIAAGLLVIVSVLSILVALEKIKETPKPATVVSGNVPDELKKYSELLNNGVITQEEFDAKKKQLLGL